MVDDSVRIRLLCRIELGTLPTKARARVRLLAKNEKPRIEEFLPLIRAFACPLCLETSHGGDGGGIRQDIVPT